MARQWIGDDYMSSQFQSSPIMGSPEMRSSLFCPLSVLGIINHLEDKSVQASLLLSILRLDLAEGGSSAWQVHSQ